MITINIVKKSSKRYPAVIMAVSLAMLTGCGGTGNAAPEHENGLNMEQTENLSEEKVPMEADSEAGSTAMKPQKPEEESSVESTDQTGGEPSAESVQQEESDIPAEPEPIVTPVLPATGKKLADFVPEGWQLMDSVELDFNRDGITDYVGVLEAEWKEDEEVWRPRILFAAASDGAGQYRLDFQDGNLIRTRDEGGVFGDPYLPMTAEGTAFTTHSYGGSAWRWAEDYTYEYMEGTWYLTLGESTYGYDDYSTDYSMDDWKAGVGIRKKSSSEFSDMEKHWNEDDPEYDLIYELTLDEMPTLRQAGMRWWLAPDRVTDWKVESIEFAGNVELEEKLVEYPTHSSRFYYNDEDCVLYKFKSEINSPDYIAMYQWQDRKLIIVAEVDSGADYLTLYKDNIYYVSDIKEDIQYRSVKGGKEYIEEMEDTVGVRLNRVNVNGTGLETVFEYRYPGTEQEVLEKRPPYLEITYEVSGDEIILEVYVGGEPHPFYRMNLDGTGQKRIGQVPKE